MPNIFNVPVAKINAVQQFDFDALSPETQQAIIMNGLKQKLNDAHASIQEKAYKTVEEFHKAVDERVADVADAIRKGEWTTRKASTTPGLSKLERRIHKLAGDMVAKKLAEKKIARKTLADGAFDKYVEAVIEKYRDQLQKQAEAELKVEAERETNGLTLDDLGI